MATAWTFILCLVPFHIFVPRDVIGIMCDQDLKKNNDKGKCYRYMTSMLNWADAETACQTLGGQLMKLEDDEDTLFVTENVVSGTYYWIGLNDIVTEHDYRWTDNSTLVWTNWRNNQPNDDDETEDQDCVIMDTANSWQDRNCVTEYKYMCEFTEDMVNERRVSKYTRQDDTAASISNMEEIDAFTALSQSDCALSCVEHPECAAMTSKSSTSGENCIIWRNILGTKSNSVSQDWFAYVP